MKSPTSWRRKASPARCSTPAPPRRSTTDTIIECVEETGRLVIVDEASPRCNIATDISALVAQHAFDALRAPIQMVTPPHTPVPFAPNLEDLYVPGPSKIEAAVRAVMAHRAATPQQTREVA